jgi:hypothetical protein
MNHNGHIMELTRRVMTAEYELELLRDQVATMEDPGNRRRRKRKPQRSVVTDDRMWNRSSIREWISYVAGAASVDPSESAHMRFNWNFGVIFVRRCVGHRLQMQVVMSEESDNAFSLAMAMLVAIHQSAGGQLEVLPLIGYRYFTASFEMIRCPCTAAFEEFSDFVASRMVRQPTCGAAVSMAIYRFVNGFDFVIREAPKPQNGIRDR